VLIEVSVLIYCLIHFTFFFSSSSSGDDDSSSRSSDSDTDSEDDDDDVDEIGDLVDGCPLRSLRNNLSGGDEDVGVRVHLLSFFIT
jgi:hypothetical protein